MPLLVKFPSLAAVAAAVVVFFIFLPVWSCPTKNCFAFLSTPSSRLSLSTNSHLCFRAGLAPINGADKGDLFGVRVDSINNISWSKRKVGPEVYVTELGTLESATAPLADCPHAVLSDTTQWRSDESNSEALFFPSTNQLFISEPNQGGKSSRYSSWGCPSWWVVTPLCSCKTGLQRFPWWLVNKLLQTCLQ